MRMEEFLAQTILDAANAADDDLKENAPAATEEAATEEESVVEEEHAPAELDIQRVVVEELAVDKAKLEEKVETLKQKLQTLESSLSVEAELKQANENLKSELEVAKAEVEAARAESNALKIQVAELQSKLAAEQERHFDEQSRNPNALALLDRDVDLPDRFPGETRDHVLEVIKEARDKAEADGRVRRAQLLEGVLVTNEPTGNLAQKRAALEKFFNDNGNILSGPVLEELAKYGIPHKNGEEYLLPSEILTRMY